MARMPGPSSPNGARAPRRRAPHDCPHPMADPTLSPGRDVSRRDFVRAALAAGGALQLGALDTRRATSAERRADGALALWYRRPAGQWVEALPLGNGRLGAMVFG